MQFLKRFLIGDKTDKDIRALVRKHFRLRVKKIFYYKKALRHSSVLDGDTTGKKSNERLEFLGDAVLGLSVAEYLYKQDESAQEGALTQRKSKKSQSTWIKNRTGGFTRS